MLAHVSWKLSIFFKYVYETNLAEIVWPQCTQTFNGTFFVGRPVYVKCLVVYLFDVYQKKVARKKLFKLIKHV